MLNQWTMAYESSLWRKMAACVTTSESACLSNKHRHSMGDTCLMRLTATSLAASRETSFTRAALRWARTSHLPLPARCVDVASTCIVPVLCTHVNVHVCTYLTKGALPHWATPERGAWARAKLDAGKEKGKGNLPTLAYQHAEEALTSGV